MYLFVCRWNVNPTFVTKSKTVNSHYRMNRHRKVHKGSNTKGNNSVGENSPSLVLVDYLMRAQA